MAEKTLISWADTSWPITVGCEKVSKGCYGCYAMRDARRMESNPNVKVSSVYSGLVIKQQNGILNWTGAIKTLPERLDDPTHWKEHKDVFVCSQSDLFHKDVDAAFIGQAFRKMRDYNQHTYYILTKRPERFLELIEQNILGDLNAENFPHVVIGISAEDQDAAEIRLPLLTQLPLPASQLFVSAEPLVGPLDLSQWMNKIGWVIAGGESGKHARPMHPSWPRRLRDQCEEANIAYHFKQWGEFLPEGLATESQAIPYTEHDTLLYKAGQNKANASTPIVLTKDGTKFYRVGRKKAGRVLDGEYWNARPGADYGPTCAAHPLNTEIAIVDAGQEYNGLVAVVTTIQPDDTKDKEFDGEDAVYYVSINGREIEQAFSYWQLRPSQPYNTK